MKTVLKSDHLDGYDREWLIGFLTYAGLDVMGRSLLPNRINIKTGSVLTNCRLKLGSGGTIVVKTMFSYELIIIGALVASIPVNIVLLELGLSSHWRGPALLSFSIAYLVILAAEMFYSFNTKAHYRIVAALENGIQNADEIDKYNLMMAK